VSSVFDLGAAVATGLEEGAFIFSVIFVSILNFSQTESYTGFSTCLAVTGRGGN